MNVTRGIFDSLPPSAQNEAVDSFSFAGKAPAASDPFAATPSVPHSALAAVPVPSKLAYIPVSRPKVAEIPFQVASDNESSYGYEALQVSHFVTAPISSAPTHQADQIQLATSPSQLNAFSEHREPVADADPTRAPQLSFASWPQPQKVATASSVEEIPVSRQLELRAIFGVDREMSTDEILQRTRSLPGVKHVAKIGYNDVVALESLKATLQGLGFDGGNISLYSGSVPIEFIRDGQTMLAVQADGSFAPGVKEAIMIVDRELEIMN